MSQVSHIGVNAAVERCLTSLVVPSAEMVGMPNNCGKNMAVIDAVTLAVNSKTEHQDVIYDLIRAMLTEDKSTGFSTVKPQFEEQLQEAAKETLENNPNAEVWDPLKDETTRLTPLSQEDVKKFYDYVVSVDTLVGYDDEVIEIVSEEVSAFFAGKKTAEEVSEIIQNRVSVYINENS